MAGSVVRRMLQVVLHITDSNSEVMFAFRKDWADKSGKLGSEFVIADVVYEMPSVHLFSSSTVVVIHTSTRHISIRIQIYQYILCCISPS